MPESILLETLNERELEIIPLLAEGLSNKEIADRLFLAPSTVKWYVRQLNSKLDTSGRDEIVKRAAELGLTQVEKPENSYLRPRSNLPYQTTPFIGRDAELDEMHRILEREDVRLLTILAPGGMGKTRIALEAAEQQANNFPDGVYFVPLQPLSEVDQIIPKIATAIGYQFVNDERNVKEQLLDFLSNRTILLCIDNWEHLLEGVVLINEILIHAPDVKVIATSREKLNLMVETVYYLQGMQFPAWETPEEALQYDAVQLLVQAAQRVKHNWQVTSENLNYVARVCRLTQGMPLGILLATSWLDMLSIQAIAEEIEKSADFLESDMRDIPERQQSIRAIFNYSWGKLIEQERSALMKMSIFRGGFSRRAAEQITGANLRTLQSLINKSLLHVNTSERYDLHELLRQYAQERLKQSTATDTVRDAHMHYHMTTLAEQDALLRSGQLLAAVDSIRIDFENVRLAWEQACIKHEYALLEKALFSFTVYLECDSVSNEVRKNLFDIARKYLLNDETKNHPVVAKVIKCYAGGQRLSFIRNSLVIAVKHEDFVECGSCLTALARYTAYTQRDFPTAIKLFEEAIGYLRRTDDKFELCLALRWYGEFLVRAGDHEKSEKLANEAQSLAGQNPFLEAHVLNVLAGIAGYKGEAKQLLEYAERAVAIGYKLPRSGALGMNMLLQAFALVQLGKLDDAQNLLQEADRIFAEFNWFAESGNRYLENWLFLYIAKGDYETAWHLIVEIDRHPHGHPDKEAAKLHMGIAACKIGAFDRAISFFMDGIKFGRQSRSEYTLSKLLTIPAFLLAHNKQFIRAAELMSLFDHHRFEWAGYRDILPFCNELLQMLRDTLPDDDFHAAWEHGKSLDLETVIDALLAEFGESAS